MSWQLRLIGVNPSDAWGPVDIQIGVATHQAEIMHQSEIMSRQAELLSHQAELLSHGVTLEDLGLNVPGAVCRNGGFGDGFDEYQGKGETATDATVVGRRFLVLPVSLPVAIFGSEIYIDTRTMRVAEQVARPEAKLLAAKAGRTASQPAAADESRTLRTAAAKLGVSEEMLQQLIAEGQVTLQDAPLP